MVLEPKLASVNGTQLEYVEIGEGSPQKEKNLT